MESIHRSTYKLSLEEVKQALCAYLLQHKEVRLDPGQLNISPIIKIESEPCVHPSDCYDIQVFTGIQIQT